MTTSERWQSTKQLRKTNNWILVINIFILLTVLLVKCGGIKNIKQTDITNMQTSNAFIKSTNGVNMRESPSINSSVVEKLLRNDRILIIDSTSNPDFVNGQSGFWLKIQTDKGNQGFIWDATVQKDN
jgi:hypothetical protein